MVKSNVRCAPRRRAAAGGHNQNSGFTLLETLLTVAILVVLLGISMVGVARWLDFLKITELDNAARSIYMAAENRAVLLQNSGTAVTLLSSSAPPPAGGGLTASETSVTLDDGTTKVVSLRTLSNTTTADLLDSLLPLEIIDPTLRDGCFYVLYDKDSCHVFEVFYAENDFAEAELSTLRDMSRSQRVSYYRENTGSRRLVGHYGGSLADKGNISFLPDPGVYVSIANNNELTLTVTYTIPPELASLDVTREPSVTLYYGGAPVPLLYVDEATVVQSPFSERLTKDVDIAGVTSPMSATYTWILDSLAADSGGGSQHFKDLFTGGAPALGGDFTVTASLKLSADGYVESSNSYTSDPENSLFDTRSVGSDTTAYIANLRHLQNLDSYSSGAAGKTAAVQLESIDASVVKNNENEELSTGYEFKPIDNPGLLSYDGGNQTISNLKVTGTSVGLKTGAGLFSVMYGKDTDQKFLMCRLLLDNPHVSGSKYAGALAGYSNFVQLTDCKISGADVNGNVHSGGMIGYWWGSAELTNCVAEGVNVESSGTAGAIAGWGINAVFTSLTAKTVTIDGAGPAGGLIGELDRGSSFKNCETAGATVKSTGSTAGGMVGANWVGDVNFEGCKAEDLTVSSTSAAAGGLLGSKGGATVRFTDCTVGKSENAGKVTITGSYAGGLAGSESGGATFDKCHVADAEVTGSDTAGGLVGGVGTETDTANATFTSCTAKEVTVSGGNYAGGLVGNSATKDDFTDCNASNANVTSTGRYSEAGGLVGRTTNASFTSCTASDSTVTGVMNAGGLAGGTVGVRLEGCETVDVSATAEHYAGGLTGNSSGGALDGCQAVNARVNGTSESNSEAGGLVGRTTGTNLKGCQVYWSDTSGLKDGAGALQYQVTAITAGGLVGAAREGGIIDSSFAATLVSGKTYAGGLVGDLSSPEPESGKSSHVIVKMSYADCYLQAGKDTTDKQTPYAGGLVGMKGTGVTLELTDVYSAGFIGFINMSSESSATAAGLCGGWATGTTAKNAYAAMHYMDYAGTRTIQPLARDVNGNGTDNCYFLEYPGSSGGTSYGQMRTLPMGVNFESKAAGSSNPYNLTGGARGAYPFPGLKGLPHYGDWPNN